jgi:hypothetical protein
MLAVIAPFDKLQVGLVDDSVIAGSCDVEMETD